MDMERLAKLEGLRNTVQTTVRDHFGKLTTDELLETANGYLQATPERALIALMYLEEVLRRGEADTMNEGEEHEDHRDSE